MNKTLDAVILRYIGYGLVFTVLLLGLWEVRGVVPIFATALLFAYAFEPIVRRLESRGYSRTGAVLFMVVIFALLFLLLLAVLASLWQQVQSLSTKFPRYAEQGKQFVNAQLPRIENSRLPENVKQSITQAVNDLQTRAPAYVTDWLRNLVGGVPGAIGTLGITLIVIPILTLYFMLEMNPLRGRLLMMVPSPYRRDVIGIADSINELLGRYVRGQMIVCGIFGAICTVAFYILSFKFGMNYPLILGIAATFLYVVPYLGMATIAIAAAATGYFTATSSQMLCAGLAVGCVVVTNLILDYVISPRVLGRGVGLHPLMVIFALLSGNTVGGIMGMILAVPVFASLRVVAIYLFPQLVAPIPQMPPESDRAIPAAENTSAVVAQTEYAERNAPSRASIFARFRRAKPTAPALDARALDARALDARHLDLDAPVMETELPLPVVETPVVVAPVESAVSPPQSTLEADKG